MVQETVNPQESKEFWTEMRKRVNAYFKDNGLKKTATSYYYIKAAIMGLMLWGPYAYVMMNDLSFGMYILVWMFIGIGVAGVGMNVMHDANHESVSKKKSVNQFFGASMFLLSGNVFNWKCQHNVLHHTYTNLYGKDDDINTDGLMRLHPSEPRKKGHRFQVYYFPLLYGLLTLNWALVKDFKNLGSYDKRGLTKQMRTTYMKEFWILLISKLVYWFAFLGMPVIMGYSVLWTILGFVAMHFVSGLVLSVIFQLAHMVHEVSHPDVDMNPSSQFANHQLSTTSNFATNNWLLTFYTGGLNFQVEHHLFPGICHVHYPKIAKIVKETAKEFNVPYYEHRTFGQAIKSHLDFLKMMGSPKVQQA